MEENSKARELYWRRQQAFIEKRQSDSEALAQAEKLQKKQKKKDKECVTMM